MLRLCLTQRLPPVTSRGYSVRDLTLIVQLCLSLIKFVFDVFHQRWMVLNHIEELAHFLILLL